MIQAGEYGFRLELDTDYDFTGFNTLTVKIRDPSGTVVSKGASTSDASSGVLYYTVESGIFDVGGQYEVQAVIEFAGKRLKSKRVQFPVASGL